MQNVTGTVATVFDLAGEAIVIISPEKGLLWTYVVEGRQVTCWAVNGATLTSVETRFAPEVLDVMGATDYAHAWLDSL